MDAPSRSASPLIVKNHSALEDQLYVKGNRLTSPSPFISIASSLLLPQSREGVEMHTWIVFGSIVGIAGVILFLLIAATISKKDRVWKKCDGPESASMNRPQAMDQSQTVGIGIQGTEPPILRRELLPEIRLKLVPRRVAWEDSSYCWVVSCKNQWVHRRRNLFHSHHIPLGETDAVRPRPAIDHRFIVQCDDCKKEYVYKPSEVLRHERELPESFLPHPLFRDDN
jgi:hypothetical protein